MIRPDRRNPITRDGDRFGTRVTRVERQDNGVADDEVGGYRILDRDSLKVENPQIRHN